MTNRLSRRRVLAGGLVVAGAAGLGLGRWQLSRDDDGVDGQLGDREATQFVAEQGIAADPTVREDARQLGIQLDRAGAEGGPPRRARVLDEMVVEDFTVGRLVLVGGWQLARTEVALAVHRAGLDG